MEFDNFGQIVKKKSSKKGSSRFGYQNIFLNRKKMRVHYTKVFNFENFSSTLMQFKKN